MKPTADRAALIHFLKKGDKGKDFHCWVLPTPTKKCTEYVLIWPHISWHLFFLVQALSTIQEVQELPACPTFLLVLTSPMWQDGRYWAMVFSSTMGGKHGSRTFASDSLSPWIIPVLHSACSILKTSLCNIITSSWQAGNVAKHLRAQLNASWHSFTMQCYK